MSKDLYTAEQIEQLFVTSIDEWNANTDRGKQKAAGRMGVSDIGHCRQAAVFMTTQTPPSDNPDKTKAFIGEALDEHYKKAVARTLREQGIDAQTKRHVMVRLPSGASYPGHPDIVIPNLVLDVKTKDGLSSVIKHGPTERNQFQRHGYAGALVQAGEFDEDRAMVGNVFVDRSGRYPRPHVQLERYDSTWLNKADDWISDVIYAVYHGEEASKDRPIEWCQHNCEWFGTCRIGDLGQGGLLSAEMQAVVVDLLEAKEAKKAAEEAVEDAKRALAGIEGSTGTHYLSWTHVNETEQAALIKRAHWRLNLRAIPTVMPIRRKR